MKTNVTVPCACGCGQDVEIDGLETAPFVSHEGQKLFCATHNCATRLNSKIEGGEFLETFKHLVCSPEGEAHMAAVATLYEQTGEDT